MNTHAHLCAFSLFISLSLFLSHIHAHAHAHTHTQRLLEGVIKGYFTTGRHVQLRCDFDESFQFLAFKQNNRKKVSGRRISINTSSSQPLLVIGSPEPGDACVWSCVVQKRGGLQVVRQAVLTHMGK